MITGDEPQTWQDLCNHGVIFDEDDAQGLSPREIRKRWPRGFGTCPECGYHGIAYASYMHYLMGDW